MWQDAVVVVIVILACAGAFWLFGKFAEA